MNNKMRYITEKQETDWLSREARELFGKAVNTILMNEKTITLDLAIMQAKIIVDKAFEFYPDNNAPQEFSHPLERTLEEEKKLMKSGKWGNGTRFGRTSDDDKQEYIVDAEQYDKENPKPDDSEALKEYENSNK